MLACTIIRKLTWASHYEVTSYSWRYWCLREMDQERSIITQLKCTIWESELWVLHIMWLWRWLLRVRKLNQPNWIYTLGGSPTGSPSRDRTRGREQGCRSSSPQVSDVSLLQGCITVYFWPMTEGQLNFDLNWLPASWWLYYPMRQLIETGHYWGAKV